MRRDGDVVWVGGRAFVVAFEAIVPGPPSGRSRSLGRRDALLAHGMRRVLGMGYGMVASALSCSEGAARAAVARVDEGRYGEVRDAVD